MQPLAIAATSRWRAQADSTSDGCHLDLKRHRGSLEALLSKPKIPGSRVRLQYNGKTGNHPQEAGKPFDLFIDFLVAEVRSCRDSRQPERTEISLGTWQITLGRAIKQYLEKSNEISAANDEADRSHPVMPSISDA